LKCHFYHYGKFDNLLKISSSQICINCHNINNILIKKHGNEKLSGKKCINCHNPHGGKDDRFLWGSSAHKAFLQGNCKKCHR